MRYIGKTITNKTNMTTIMYIWFYCFIKNDGKAIPIFVDC